MALLLLVVVVVVVLLVPVPVLPPPPASSVWRGGDRCRGDLALGVALSDCLEDRVGLAFPTGLCIVNMAVCADGGDDGTATR